jgi:hypothetical protein
MMIPEPHVALRSLLTHPNFLNKETHFKLGSSRMFALLADNDPLSRVAATGPVPDLRNLAAFYHLNMLQLLQPADDMAIQAGLQMIRRRQAGLPELMLAGARPVRIPAGALDSLEATLVDLWLLDREGVRKVTLCTNAVGPTEAVVTPVDGSGAGLATPAVMVAGNLARAAFLYGLAGYFRLLLEAGRLIERFGSFGLHLQPDVDLVRLNRRFSFNAERYSCLAALSPEPPS